MSHFGFYSYTEGYTHTGTTLPLETTTMTHTTIIMAALPNGVRAVLTVPWGGGLTHL